jgi:hypothetical protein
VLSISASRKDGLKIVLHYYPLSVYKATCLKNISPNLLRAKNYGKIIYSHLKTEQKRHPAYHPLPLLLGITAKWTKHRRPLKSLSISHFSGPDIKQTIAHCSNWRSTLPASSFHFYLAGK